MSNQAAWTRYDCPKPGLVGRNMTYVVHHEITGGEEVCFDEHVHAISQAGYHIVDKQLTIDPTHSPPVWGWICYRETTNGERNRQ